MPQLIASVEGVAVKRIYLTRDHTTLGRKAGNDIVLDNLAVSGNHCAFELRGLADVFVEDLGSTNGTLVNGVRPTTIMPLIPGCLLSIGDAIVLSYEVVA